MPKQSVAEEDEAATEAPSIEYNTEALKNDSGKIMLKSLTKDKSGSRHATVAIVSASGTVVIADPHEIPLDDGFIKADVVTVSHGHFDHMDINYLQKYFNGLVEGTTSVIKAEQLSVNDVQVTGIAASHSVDFSVDSPSDIIHVFEALEIKDKSDVDQLLIDKEELEQIIDIKYIFLK